MEDVVSIFPSTPWTDPAVVEMRRLPMRPPLVVSDSVEAMRQSRAVRRKSLDGTWRLRLVEAPLQVGEAELRAALRHSESDGATW